MSLSVIDFTYLDGRDDEFVVMELAAVDSHTKRVSSYDFNTAGRKYQCFTLE
jgi:hypothetical protein